MCADAEKEKGVGPQHPEDCERLMTVRWKGGRWSGNEVLARDVVSSEVCPLQVSPGWGIIECTVGRVTIASVLALAG